MVETTEQMRARIRLEQAESERRRRESSMARPSDDGDSGIVADVVESAVGAVIDSFDGC